MQKMKKIWDKWGKSVFVLAIIFIVIFALSGLIYVQKVRPESVKQAIETVVAMSGNIMEIQESKVLEQEFTSTEEEIAGITLMFQQFQQENLGKLYIKLVDLENPDMTTEEAELDVRSIISQSAFQVQFADYLEDVKGHRCKIILTVDFAEGSGNKFGLYTADREDRNVELKVDGKGSGEPFSFGLILPEDNGFLKTGFFAALFIICFLVLGLYYLLFIRKVKVETAFLIIGFAVGILYTFLVKPNSVPDEVTHYSFSVNRSNQMMGKTDLELPGNNEYVQVPTAVEAYRDINTKFFDKGSDEDYDVNWSVTDDGPFYLHVISGLGITIARILHLSTVAAFYLGRFLNLAFFILCTYFGMKRLPFGKMALFALALFPMTIHLAASYSYDAIINGMCFFFISYCVYLAFDKEKESIHWKDMIVLMIWGMLICGSKGGAYIPACAAVLLIPRRKFGETKKLLQKLGALAASCGIWYLLLNLSKMQQMSGGSEPYVEWAGEAGFSLGMLVQSPVNSITMLVNTCLQKADMWLMNLVGKQLGWVDTQRLAETMDVLVIGFLILFLIGLLSESSETKPVVAGWKRLMLTAAILLSIGMSIMAMWLNWTPVSFPYVEGVQGRYFLPMIPMLIVILKNNLIVLKKNIDMQLAYSVFLLQIPTMLKIFDSLVAG